MGLETILFYVGAGGGAMAALGPATAIIRPGSGDAYIVAVAESSLVGERVTLTCPQDARWDAAGFIWPSLGNGGVQDGQSFNMSVLPKKVPIRRGTTLAANSFGAGIAYCLVYIEYPDIGPKYAPRMFGGNIGTAQLAFRLATAGAATVADTMTLNSVGVANFAQGRHYTLVGLSVQNANAGPQNTIGFTDPKTGMTTWWYFPITDVLTSGQLLQILPEGVCSPLTLGDTLQCSFTTGTAATPQVNLVFAHDSGA